MKILIIKMMILTHFTGQIAYVHMSTRSYIRQHQSRTGGQGGGNLNKGLCDGQTYGGTDGPMDRNVAYKWLNDRLPLGKASAMICLFPLSKTRIFFHLLESHLLRWLVSWLIFGRLIVQLVYKHIFPPACDAETFNLPKFAFCKIRYSLIYIIKKSVITR